MKRTILIILPAFFCAVFAAATVLPIPSATAATCGIIPQPTPPYIPPPPPPLENVDDVIRIESELVNLNVRVVDRNNRPINNVLQSDFKIYEDGVPQSIEFFSH